MRMRIVVLILGLGLLTASAALGKNGPRPAVPGNPAACKPMRAVTLKGTFLAGGAESFQMDVKKANRHGRTLRGTREVRVDARTKFRRLGNAATLASLQANDRLNVHVRACKRAQATGTDLLARRVVAQPAKSG
jgi:hypothetical protein